MNKSKPKLKTPTKRKQKVEAMCTSDILRLATHEKQTESLTVRIRPAYKRFIQALPRKQHADFVDRAIRHELLNTTETKRVT